VRPWATGLSVAGRSHLLGKPFVLSFVEPITGPFLSALRSLHSLVRARLVTLGGGDGDLTSLGSVGGSSLRVLGCILRTRCCVHCGSGGGVRLEHRLLSC
jgi:hypothetical protein